jgi:hypothetical protein
MVNPLKYLASMSQNCDVHPLVVTEECVLSLAKMLGGYVKSVTLLGRYVPREYPEVGHIAKQIRAQRIS